MFCFCIILSSLCNHSMKCIPFSQLSIQIEITCDLVLGSNPHGNELHTFTLLLDNDQCTFQCYQLTDKKSKEIKITRKQKTYKEPEYTVGSGATNDLFILLISACISCSNKRRKKGLIQSVFQNEIAETSPWKLMMQHNI